MRLYVVSEHLGRLNLDVRTGEELEICRLAETPTAPREIDFLMAKDFQGNISVASVIDYVIPNLKFSYLVFLYQVL